MSSSKLPATMLAMAQGLKASRQEIGSQANFAFIKFTKNGAWVWGMEEIEVEEDSQWVINPESFQHGWVSWGDEELGNPGEKCGEIMTSVTQPIMPLNELPETQGSWKKQIAFQLMCITGGDKDTQVIFNTSSGGGLDLYSKVVGDLAKRIDKNIANIVPLILLRSSKYKHPRYSWIYKPEIEYLKWFDLDTLQELVDAANPESVSSADQEAQEREDEEEATVDSKKLLTQPKPRAKKTRKSESMFEDDGEVIEVTPEEIPAKSTTKVRTRPTRQRAKR